MTGAVADDPAVVFFKQRAGPYKYPRKIEFVTELPKTQSGKIQRFKLREQAAAD